MTIDQLLIQRIAFFEIDTNVQQEGPFNQTNFTPGLDDDPGSTQDSTANHQADGGEFEEFDQFRRDRSAKLRRVKEKVDEMRANDAHDPDASETNQVLQPVDSYQNQYGHVGIEGVTTSPLEYYSGSIMNEPGAITNNPYNTIYQSAGYQSAGYQSAGYQAAGTDPSANRRIRTILRASYYVGLTPFHRNGTVS